MAELSIPVHDVDESGKDYAFRLSRAWLDGVLADAALRADPARGEGGLHVHVQKNGPSYLVHGELDAELLAQCCRCLGDAPVSVHVPVTVLFTQKGKLPHTAAEELSDDERGELDRETWSGNELVLDDLVREYLLVECPMQPLCSEACEGIPLPDGLRPPEDLFGPSRGGVDPRLAPLSRLRDKVRPNKLPSK